MTAWTDALAKADAVLDVTVSNTTARIRAQQCAPDLARALKAVAEALEEAELDTVNPRSVPGADFVSLDDIRAAIERRLVKP